MSNTDEALRLPPEHERRIAAWLQQVKFRKQFFGGVRESDVFKKIGELNELYKQALIAERARYDALLAASGTDAVAEGDAESGGDAK